VQHIGQQQLLVLLFVLQTQFKQGADVGQAGRLGLLQKPQHTLLHRRAIGLDLGQRWPCQQTPLRARVLLAHRLVVAVEKRLEGRVVRFELRLKTFQHKGFKKPGGVRQVPFAGAGVRHGLHLGIGFAQGGGQCQSLRAHLGEALGQYGGVSHHRYLTNSR
jgi:hypothetical protein